MRILAGVCLATLALAACDRSGDKPDAPDAKAVAKGEASAPVSPDIKAAPVVAGGLWEISSRAAGAAGKVRTCFDPALQGESAVVAQGMNRRYCSRSEWTRTADGYSFEVACEQGGRMFVSTGVLGGDLKTTYTIKADAVMSLNGVTQGAQQDIVARNVGECPADLRPGEVQVLTDGGWRRPTAAAAPPAAKAPPPQGG